MRFAVKELCREMARPTCASLNEGLGFLAGCADLGIWTDGMVSLKEFVD